MVDPEIDINSDIHQKEMRIQGTQERMIRNVDDEDLNLKDQPGTGELWQLIALNSSLQPDTLLQEY